MKYLSLLILAFIMVSCVIKNEEEIQGPVVLSNNGEVEPVDSPYSCYLYAKNKDTIRLQIKPKDKEWSGWLHYQFNEKDGSIGEVEGELVGDTLKLEYEFLSEGLLSKMEVYFLQKEGKLYQGSSDRVMEDDSVMVFKNPSKIKYTDHLVLEALNNCGDDFISSSDKRYVKKMFSRN